MSAQAEMAQGAVAPDAGKIGKRRKQSLAEKFLYAAAYASMKGDHTIGAGDGSGVFDVASFPFLQQVEERKGILRQETEALLQNEGAIPSFQHITQLPEGGRKTEVDDDWKNWLLFLYGKKFHDNCRACPGITRMLEEDIPGVQTALLSILHPHTRIKAHVGELNGMLRLHVPIIIPEGGKCGLKVGDRVLNWAEEDLIVFDHSVEHYAWNDSDEIRVILIVDFLRDTAFPWSAVSKLAVFALTQTSYFKGAADRIQRAGPAATLPGALA